MNTLALAAENFLWIASVLALLAFGAAAVVRGLTESGRCTVSPPSLASFYATVIIAPPVGAAWIVLAAFLPVLALGDAFHGAHAWATHDDHLFSGLLHPFQPGAQRIASAALVVLMTGAGVAVVAAAWQMRAALRVLGAARLDARSRPAAGALDGRRLRVTRVRSDLPVCLLWGVRRPRIIVSDGLIAALRARELRAVLEHERAHAARHDNLARLVLGVCAHASLAWPLLRRVVGWHAEQAELICDETAAAHTGTPLALAHALVAVHRRARAMAVPHTAGLVSPRPGSLERRVRRLLTFAGDGHRRPARSTARFGTTALAVLGIFTVSLAAVHLAAPLSVHAIAELLLRPLS